MKLVGLFIIFFISIGIGFNKIYLLRTYGEEIRHTVIFLNQLKSNLEFYLSTPKELFKTTVLPFPFAVRDETISLMDKGVDFHPAFISAVNKSQTYIKEDKKLILEIASFLGLFDKETQIKRLELMIKEFDSLCSLRSKQQAEKEKLCLTCSISFGLGLIIILI